jgi:hypothetical protein
MGALKETILYKFILSGNKNLGEVSLLILNDSFGHSNEHKKDWDHL